MAIPLTSCTVEADGDNVTVTDTNTEETVTVVIGDQGAQTEFLTALNGQIQFALDCEKRLTQNN